MKKRVALWIGIVLFIINGALLYYKMGIHPPDISNNPPVQSNPIREPLDSHIPPQSKEIEPEFVEVKKYRTSESNTVYGDIISHSRDAPFGDGSGRSTNAHETTHGINSEIRNAHRSEGKINGFYVLQGRGVILKEPSIKMSNALRFVPQNLRSYRWSLYMEQQLHSWNDTPTYIFDEWVAYVNGGACGVDDVKNGGHKESWSDGVSGCCDFSIYAIALAMATKADDPEYWKTNVQFKNFVLWELRFAEKIFLEGRVMKQFKWEKQDKLLLQLLTSKDAEPMRKFLREELSGVWLDIDPELIKKIDYDGTPRD